MKETIMAKLKTLIHDDTTPEDLAVIQEVENDLDEDDKKYNELLETSHNIRDKYAKLLMSGNFASGEDVKTSPTPKSDEEILNDVLSNTN